MVSGCSMTSWSTPAVQTGWSVASWRFAERPAYLAQRAKSHTAERANLLIGSTSTFHHRRSWSKWKAKWRMPVPASDNAMPRDDATLCSSVVSSSRLPSKTFLSAPTWCARGSSTRLVSPSPAEQVGSRIGHRDMAADWLDGLVGHGGGAGLGRGDVGGAEEGDERQAGEGHDDRGHDQWGL